jgi:hypothetical protein
VGYILHTRSLRSLPRRGGASQMQLYGTLGLSVLPYEGVAVASRGDVITVLYKEPARLHRSRWVYDQTDRLAQRCPKGILGLMIILPTSTPPDGPTRAENSARLRRLGPLLRRLVTVPLGNEVTRSLVRSVVRSTSVLQGGAPRMHLSETLEGGIASLLESSSSLSPTFDTIAADVQMLCDALHVDEPALVLEGARRTGNRTSGVHPVVRSPGDRRAVSS